MLIPSLAVDQEATGKAVPAMTKVSGKPNAEDRSLHAIKLHVTAAQKMEWMYCEEGSYEDCIRLREEGASTASHQHVYEVLRRGRNTEVVISSPVEMLLLVKSLGTNQYSETQPAMFKRLWSKLIESARRYPLGAADREEVARIEVRIKPWT